MMTIHEGLVSHSKLHGMVEKNMDLAVEKMLIECVGRFLAKEEDGVVVEDILSDQRVEEEMEVEWYFPNDIVLQEKAGTYESPSMKVPRGLVTAQVESQAMGHEGYASGGEVLLSEFSDGLPVEGLTAC